MEAFENNGYIQAVNIANNSITEELSLNVKALLNSPESMLKYINLADNYLNDETFENIRISPFLRSLVLRNNSIEDEGARRI